MRKTLTLLLLCAIAPLASAAPPRVEGPWIRATPPGAATGAAYARLIGNGTADRLIGAQSAVADRVEIHTHVQRDGMMQMTKIDALAIPADGSGTLEPGADHLMLIGLHRPLTAGESVSMTLVFEKSGEMVVTFPVVDARAEQPPPQQHSGH